VLGIGNKPFDYDEKDVEIVSFVADVIWNTVDHKRSEEALRESETKFHRIIEQSTDAIILTDEQGAIIEWNRGAEQITGMKRSVVLGSTDVGGTV